LAVCTNALLARAVAVIELATFDQWGDLVSAPRL
jgi:hypothetical protein